MCSGDGVDGQGVKCEGQGAEDDEGEQASVRQVVRQACLETKERHGWRG